MQSHAACIDCNINFTVLPFQLARASDAVLSLERLNSNYYRGLYRRKRELGFCGEVVAQNPWLLSTGKHAIT